MAGRPPKMIGNCVGHRTKEEREARAAEEARLLTGETIREWAEVKKHPVAHKHFLKLKRLYRSIDKDEALIENVINRYCLIQAECTDYGNLYDRLLRDIDQLDTVFNAPDQQVMDYITYLDRKTKLYTQLGAADKQLQKKRAMLLAIEKENIMTLQGMLRAVPKKPTEEEDDTLQEFLNRRNNRGDEDGRGRFKPSLS